MWDTQISKGRFIAAALVSSPCSPLPAATYPQAQKPARHCPMAPTHGRHGTKDRQPLGTQRVSQNCGRREGGKDRERAGRRGPASPKKEKLYHRASTLPQAAPPEAGGHQACCHWQEDVLSCSQAWLEWSLTWSMYPQSSFMRQLEVTVPCRPRTSGDLCPSP